MCGIAGLLGAGEHNRVLLSRFLELQAHRGPDGSGIWSEQFSDGRSLHFGHRRLAIIDLSDAAAQPMEDPTGRIVLTYNGEIYNYLEIRQEMLRHGVSFRTNSDSEVIIEAYMHWGPACLDRFNGMFAFALYDRLSGKLFCARDRFGEKPFLFSINRDFFAFASEYKALLTHPKISLDCDEMRLIRAAYSPGLGLDAERQTVFNAIQQLLPGEAMEVDVRTLAHKIWRYWQIRPIAPNNESLDADIFAEFRELLIDAVRLRLRSDVTVGSCLSGGLDSSAIVCIARNLVGVDVPYHTFTGRFPGTPADEWNYASDVIAHTGVISHSVAPTVDGFLDNLPEFIWQNELPVGSSSQFAQWCVFRLAKAQGITVLLDGQGSDEILGGYEQYFTYYVQALAERGETDRLARELPMIRARYPLAMRSHGRALRDRLPFRLRHWLSSRFGLGTNMLYGLELDVSLDVIQSAAKPRKGGFNPLANALEQDAFGRILTTLLRYGDRNSMAHSREVRLPFCDHRIAEFAICLPPHLLMGEVQTKRLLRESMRGILPESVRMRWNKQGFLPPQALWFRSPRMLATVRDMVTDARFSDGGPWLRKWWDNALDRVDKGQVQLGSAIWQPFMIAAWHKLFLDRVVDERSEKGASSCAA